MIREAIILAGGLGTRLREKVPDLPKCMAPVAGEPFLVHVIRHLLSQGIERFIFSLGYKHELIESFLASDFAYLDYTCVLEDEPLGTGGAIRKACGQAHESQVLVVNGDTLFRVDLPSLYAFHCSVHAICTLALKPMVEFDRYGLVIANEQGVIERFAEKNYYPSGLINGGVYLLDRLALLGQPFPEKFSFEKDYLEKQTGRGRLYGQSQNGYFIDIGIPSDYEKAQEDLKHLAPDLNVVDKRWTLFLDRDGVINHDKVGSYIFNAGEFRFYPGLPGDFRKLSERFGHIIVVTNQRGVGRGLMSESDLSGIHEKMLKEVADAGGRIDAIYYCTATENNDPRRKPYPGMALQAKKDFPSIDFSKSIIVGNNISDMRFGRNAGIYTVFVTTTQAKKEPPHPEIDLQFPLLTDFVRSL